MMNESGLCTIRAQNKSVLTIFEGRGEEGGALLKNKKDLSSFRF